MRLWIIIAFVSALGAMGCFQQEPNYAHIVLEQQGEQYAPQLDLLLQDNALSIQIKLDGTSVYDTSHLLSAEQSAYLYASFSEMGTNIYNTETPEWKNRKSTLLQDSQFKISTQLALKLKNIDDQYNTMYRSYVQAAEQVEEKIFTDSQIVEDAELLDSLKAD